MRMSAAPAVRRGPASTSQTPMMSREPRRNEVREDESGARNPDQLAATGARKGKPEIRLERDVAATAELRARRADRALADFDGLHLQRPSRLRIGNLARRRRSCDQVRRTRSWSMP